MGRLGDPAAKGRERNRCRAAFAQRAGVDATGAEPERE
jgi:hypothetical protein